MAKTVYPIRDVVASVLIFVLLGLHVLGYNSLVDTLLLALAGTYLGIDLKRNGIVPLVKKKLGL